MYYVSMNIGYSTESQSGILNTIPFVWKFDSVREFTSWIRTQQFNILLWSVDNYVPKSSLIMYVSINRYYMEDGEEWNWSNEFAIKCKNIREYKPFINLSREEIEALRREQKIDEVIGS